MTDTDVVLNEAVVERPDQLLMLADELKKRALWLADRHRVNDAILMQRSERFLRAYLAALPPSQDQQRVGEQFRAVWNIVEEYRRRHDPYNGDCEVCGMIRRMDAALYRAALRKGEPR